MIPSGKRRSGESVRPVRPEGDPAPAARLDREVAARVSTALRVLDDAPLPRGSRVCLWSPSHLVCGPHGPANVGDDGGIDVLGRRGGGRCRRCRRFLSLAANRSPFPEQLACKPSFVAPIRWAEGLLGLVVVDRPVNGGADRLRDVSSRLAYAVKRAQVNAALDHHLPLSPGLAGESAAMAAVDLFLERASTLRLPVLVSGEAGCEMTEVARAIHALGAGSEGFVEVDCSTVPPDRHRAELEEHLRGLEAAAGCTLFLSRIETLSPADQSWMAARLHRSIGPRAGDAPGVRVVASVETGPDAAGPHGLVVPRLLVELDFLSLHLRPLRERREDVRALGTRLVRRLTGREAAEALDEEAWSALEGHAWPMNLLELRSALVRLLTVSPERPIGLRELSRWLPWAAVPSGPPARPGEAVSPGVSGSSPGRELATACAAGASDRPPLPVPDPRLERVIGMIARDPGAALRLADLARQAHLSVSHLSQLFRDHLGVSPMQFLAAVRLEKAARLLREDWGSSVTEVAGGVGFGDLRHFERQFKKRFGVTPTAWRRRATASAAAP